MLKSMLLEVVNAWFADFYTDLIIHADAYHAALAGNQPALDLLDVYVLRDAERDGARRAELDASIDALAVADNLRAFAALVAVRDPGMTYDDLLHIFTVIGEAATYAPA